MIGVMSGFKRIETKRKSAYAAEQIIDAIRQGRFQVGDRLPPERDVAEQMDVSRPSIREAISALQLVGVLESRVGDGTYVAKALADVDEEYRAVHLLEESESLPEAFEARRVLEEGIAGLAAEKATEGDLRDIEDALASMEQAATAEDFKIFNRANQDFHQALAQATHNSLLIRTLDPLLEVMRQTLPERLREMFYESDQERFARTYAVHCELFRAVRDRDRDRATRAMADHFELLQRDLEESLRW